MDYTRLFDDYGIPYDLRVNRGWVNVKCPWCDDHSYNLGFNPDGNYCNCWRCGGHPHVDTLAKVLNVRTKDVFKLIKDYEFDKFSHAERVMFRSRTTSLVLPNEGFCKAERKYLMSRNFDPDMLHDRYGVVGGGIYGKWKFRIIIPLYVNGVLVSWTGRSILDKGRLKEFGIPRYKNLSIDESIIDPKSTLFNLDHSNKDTCILTEGAFDVMRIGDDCVCSFGTEVTQAQIGILSRRYERVFVMFDNEPEAQTKARKYGGLLSSLGVYVEIVDAYSDYNKNDGAELTDEEVMEIRSELGL